MFGLMVIIMKGVDYIFFRREAGASLLCIFFFLIV